MADGKVKRERSPAFPFIPLGTAIKRIENFEKTFKHHPAPANKAGLAWNMKEKSSQAFQTLAALKSFGLVNYKSTGDDRVATLSDDARTYLRAQQNGIKREVLQRCALKPKTLAKYWSIWGSERPPTPVCKDELVLKGGFTGSAAETFLHVYDETIGYAGLSDSDKISEINKKNEPKIPKVGDLVQWESDGTLQFSEPRRIRAVQEDTGHHWVFVDGSETGISAEEIIVEVATTSTGTVKSDVRTPPTMPLGALPVDALVNECEAMRGKLSSNTSYRLIVSGELGSKEIGKLIKMLEAQKAVLSDDEEESEA